MDAAYHYYQDDGLGRDQVDQENSERRSCEVGDRRAVKIVSLEGDLTRNEFAIIAITHILLCQ